MVLAFDVAFDIQKKGIELPRQQTKGRIILQSKK
jgi:hypothetical protein